MRIRLIALEHFRNIPLARLALEGRRQFLVGANGQGKTNLLEAAGFITALRSFRGAEPRHLIAHGQAVGRVVVEVEHERLGEVTLEIVLRGGSKEVLLGGQRLGKLAEVIGRLPTVEFSSQDQQLIRGSPAGRRRWLDLTLAATDGAYLRALQGYNGALAGRNALLKRGAEDGELAAFEQPLAAHGAELVAARAAGLAALAAELTAAYGAISDAAEPVGFAYAPDVAEGGDEGALREKFASGRARERQLRATVAGPHRDDFTFTLQERPAVSFASEGQQRSLVLALRLAQAEWFRARLGVQPVLLADDVLGELDPVRRRRFWAAVPAEAQVMATGTAGPEAELGAWQVFRVAGGGFAQQEAV